jgi:uncharacterized membrane protein
MRAGILVVGIVLIILGGVLMFIPLIQSSSANLSTTQPAYEVNVTGFSITGTIPGTISWTSNQAVTMDAGTCSAVSSNNTCTGSRNILSSENGTSGTFTFSVAPGGAIVVGMIGGDAATASVTVKLAQTTVGLILLVVGIILLLVGAVTHKKVPPAAPVPPPVPPTTPPPM